MFNKVAAAKEAYETFDRHQKCCPTCKEVKDIALLCAEGVKLFNLWIWIESKPDYSKKDTEEFI